MMCNETFRVFNSLTEYYLADALGSMRQLTDSTGEVVLARAYDRYGSLVYNYAYNEISTPYGYTGEIADPSGMVYLRARYYSPAQGRFVSRDVWEGNFSKPLSLNRWNYVESNPVNRLDPSGHISEDESVAAEAILEELKTKYNVIINKDWGAYYYYVSDPEDPSFGQGEGIYCWQAGCWGSLGELDNVRDAVEKIAPQTMSIQKFNKAFQRVRISRFNVKEILGQSIRSFAPPGALADLLGDIVLTDSTMHYYREEYRIGSIIHEFGHVWDYRTNDRLSRDLMTELNTWFCSRNFELYSHECWHPDTGTALVDAPDNVKGCRPGFPNPNDPTEICKRPYSATYSIGFILTKAGAEDWAQSFVGYIYPEYFKYYRTRGLKTEDIRYTYVKQQIENIH